MDSKIYFPNAEKLDSTKETIDPIKFNITARKFAISLSQKSTVVQSWFLCLNFSFFVSFSFVFFRFQKCATSACSVSQSVVCCDSEVYKYWSICYALVQRAC